jgi:hypothetical protein
MRCLRFSGAVIGFDFVSLLGQEEIIDDGWVIFVGPDVSLRTAAQPAPATLFISVVPAFPQLAADDVNLLNIH